MSLKRFLSTFPPLALVLTMGLFAAPPAVAQDDDEEPGLMSQILGAAGVIHIPGNGIDYQERPPLVVPPSTTAVQPQAAPAPQTNPNDPWNFNATSQNVSADPPPPNPALVLPPPVENDARARNPNFPVNPETKAAAKRKKQGPKNRFFSDNPFYNGRTLRPDELRSPTAPGPAHRGPIDPNVHAGDNAQSTVQELNVPVVGTLFRKFGAGETETPQPFTGEPERVELTQPPAGYLTPSRNAPYGVTGQDTTFRQEVRGPSNSPNVEQLPR